MSRTLFCQFAKGWNTLQVEAKGWPELFRILKAVELNSIHNFGSIGNAVCNIKFASLFAAKEVDYERGNFETDLLGCDDGHDPICCWMLRIDIIRML